MTFSWQSGDKLYITYTVGIIYEHRTHVDVATQQHIKQLSCPVNIVSRRRVALLVALVQNGDG